VLLIAAGFLVGRITAPRAAGPSAQQPLESQDGPVTALEKSQSEAASGSATNGAAVSSAQQGATITGIVVDEAGKPVPQASISIAGPPSLPSADRETPPRAPSGELGTTAGPVPAIPVGQTAGAVLGPTRATTDAAGSFSLLGLPTGRLQVVASAAGYAPSAITVDETTERAAVRITLRKAGIVEGTAQDDQGTALEAVLIIGRTEDGLTATAMSDADGDFTLEDVRGKLQVQAFADAHVPASCEVEVTANEKLRCDFVLTKSEPQAGDAGGRIAGYVLDSLGYPVAGATVWTDEKDATTVTNARGEFTLVNVAPGALHVLAEEKSAGTAQSKVVRAREGETLNDVRVYLPRRFTSTSALPPAVTQAAENPSQATPRTSDPAELALELRAGKVMIARVPAAANASGLQVGDILDAVDGERVLSLGQARGMLRDPPGVLARLRVVRGRERVIVRYRRPKL
jgi:hypothetical protein